MSFSEKSSMSAEDAETLVAGISGENASLSDSSGDNINITNLISSDFQTLTELSHELSMDTSSEMETEATIKPMFIEREVVVGSQEIIEHEEEVETEEMVTEELEMQPEQSSRDSKSIISETKSIKTATVPPLRPLTIAPKPTKVPLAVKTADGQLLLLQGAGTGQAIKLVSPQGQELNLTNLISRPVTLKSTLKTVSSQGGNISLIQQKPVTMKKIIAPAQSHLTTKTLTNLTTKPLTTFTKQGQHFMVVQKTDQQPMKIVQSQGGNLAIAGPSKTLTLQQAQELGIISNTKIIQQSQSAPKQTLLITKNPQKALKFVPQAKTVTLTTSKGMNKILPTTKLPQRIIFKAPGSTQTILPQGQLIQVPGTQGLNMGQLHQINIPGKGVQYIKFVAANTTESTATTLSTSTGTAVKTSAGTTITTNIVLSDLKTVPSVSKIAPKPMPGKVAITPLKPLSTPLMVVPNSISSPLPVISKVAIPAQPSKSSSTKSEGSSPPTPKDEVDVDGMRPRKPCNCNKSQCLKLYCDCFANGEFCYMCNCTNCFNNLDNEEHRNRAIKACLERNPHAFRPKIGKAKESGDSAIRKHTKGCNCKRSGCLKNYCECYEAKIACSNNCKCISCRNIEDSIERKNHMRLMTNEKATNTPTSTDNHLISSKDFAQTRPRRSSNSRKQTINFITDDVIEATCQCLLTISDNADENLQDEEVTKSLIIEEFGRCLTEIIDCSSGRNLI
ncbi:unnamed protein product [Phaedon cochleariae]|uniref:CRC domain-containing protein n=1 Tax=Phaedon cochleariae TaxID=80249 RepID=A0A9N9X026_PHACE|nr:unnamed protein product [Phaedon cochleariae]